MSEKKKIFQAIRNGWQRRGKRRAEKKRAMTLTRLSGECGGVIAGMFSAGELPCLPFHAKDLTHMLTCTLWLPSLPPDFISQTACRAQRTDWLPFTPPIRRGEVIAKRRETDTAVGIAGTDYAKCQSFYFLNRKINIHWNVEYPLRNRVVAFDNDIMYINVRLLKACKQWCGCCIVALLAEHGHKCLS